MQHKVPQSIKVSQQYHKVSQQQQSEGLYQIRCSRPRPRPPGVPKLITLYKHDDEGYESPSSLSSSTAFHHHHHPPSCAQTAGQIKCINAHKLARLDTWCTTQLFTYMVYAPRKYLDIWCMYVQHKRYVCKLARLGIWRNLRNRCAM